MDHEIRKSGLAGNYCALVMELEGVPDHTEIAQRCTDFTGRFPLVVARLSRQGRQYAWIPSDDNSLPFQVSKLDKDPGGATCRQRLLKIINKSAAVSASAPFELHLIESADRSLLALRWFHPASDAKGAELVLHHLFNNSQLYLPQSPLPVDRLLRQWGLWRKFSLARQAVHNIHRLDRQASVLPVVDTQCSADRLALKLVCYDREQTARIMAHARQHTGMTGTALYLIGCMMRAMEAAGVTQAGDAYCVPYAVNLRRRKALSPVLGNQVSFLFAQAGRDLVRSRQQLFAQLADQNRAAIRQGLDHAMLPLMQAGSWLSLDRYGRIVRDSPSKRERSSFWFSYTGDMEPEPVAIAGCQVRGMYQISQVTSPPGLGVLACNFQGRLVLSYNYINHQVQTDWLERLTQAMTAELLDLDEKLL